MIIIVVRFGICVSVCRKVGWFFIGLIWLIISIIVVVGDRFQVVCVGVFLVVFGWNWFVLMLLGIIVICVVG